MTSLERLIKVHTEGATLTTISGATERIAEEMAREILKDESFRAEMRALVSQHFGTTMRALAKNGKRGRRKRTR